MAKVSQSIVLTFRVGNVSDNHYAKIGIDISEIDTGLPLEPQLAEVDTAIQAVWEKAKSQMGTEVKKIYEKLGNPANG